MRRPTPTMARGSSRRAAGAGAGAASSGVPRSSPSSQWAAAVMFGWS
ncbi:hypothetical protein ACFQVA_41900 [Actinomadura keratinilytica]